MHSLYHPGDIPGALSLLLSNKEVLKIIEEIQQELIRYGYLQVGDKATIGELKEVLKELE
jgi:hypothetical protein